MIAMRRTAWEDKRLWEVVMRGSFTRSSNQHHNTILTIHGSTVSEGRTLVLQAYLWEASIVPQWLP
jgi:hypothetical protein